MPMGEAFASLTALPAAASCYCTMSHCCSGGDVGWDGVAPSRSLLVALGHECGTPHGRCMYAYVCCLFSILCVFQSECVCVSLQREYLCTCASLTGCVVRSTSPARQPLPTHSPAPIAMDAAHHPRRGVPHHPFIGPALLPATFDNDSGTVVLRHAHMVHTSPFHSTACSSLHARHACRVRMLFSLCLHHHHHPPPSSGYSTQTFGIRKHT